ncbi:MAG: ATP-binding protein [Deltaproteobacteria bacterium]|nr:ATP-binding protein [Deltaproteobacteria bacterium]
MKRAKLSILQQDKTKKMILLMGPRQVGKTTLSKEVAKDFQYLNYDRGRDRKIIHKLEWDRTRSLVILDELHKMRKWKSWIKGVYDTEKRPPHFLVTGSARLDVYRRGGDSLAGRHFSHRLHPFTVRELMGQMEPEETLDRILKVGGFPEPFLENDPAKAGRWRASHLDVILREDLIDLERVREIRSIEILIDLLRERVGGLVSYSSLAEELGVSVHTIKHWLEILGYLYVIFRVSPYSRNIARSLKKESKYYFYDTGAVEGNEGQKLENVVAGALLREIDLCRDEQGLHGDLFFLRDKSKDEVDFLVTINRKPRLLVEVKWNDDNFAKALFRFKAQLSEPVQACQIVRNLSQPKSKDGVQMTPVHEFLANVKLG